MGSFEIIKRNGQIIQLNNSEPFRAVKSATLNSSLMGDDNISLSIVSTDFIHFDKGDKLIYNGAEYFIRTKVPGEIKSDRYHTFEPIFYGVMFDLMKTLFRNCDSDGKSDKNQFDLTYQIKDFVKVIINNLNRDYPGLWAFDEDNCPDTDHLTLQFSSVNCLQALQTICSEDNFNLEFQITQENGVRTIHIGKFGTRINPPGGMDYFEWGKGNGLYTLKEQKVDDKAIITRLWVEGGSNNIRINYRDYAERLQLPFPRRKNTKAHTLEDGTEVAPNSEYIGISDDTKRYLEDPDLRDAIGSDEDAKIYDQIYPKRTGTVSALVDGDPYSFIDDSMDFDLNEKDENGTLYLIDGVTAKITFISGKLAGQEFELEAKGGYDHATKKFKIIPFTDDRGLTVPTEGENSPFPIQASAQYKITDINLPDSYVENAEEDLWYEGNKDFRKMKQARAQYALTFDRSYFLDTLPRDTDVQLFQVGDYVPVKDDRFGIQKPIRIQKITRNLLVEHDYQLTLSDITAISIATQTIITVQDHDQIIENNQLKDLNKAKRGWRTTEELRSMVYDTDGYFDVDNIRPNSIDTNMLTVGSKSQQFVLISTLLQANYQGNPNLFYGSSGVMAHLTILEDGIRYWHMSGGVVNLTSSGFAYFLFAKCSKSGNGGTWYITTEPLKFEPVHDPNNYYFQVGVISSVGSGDFRDFVTTYGFTRINGNTITTGRIVTSDGESYLDLDGNKFKIGTFDSYLDFNVTRDGQITLHNVKLLSESGDTFPVGVYRGVYDPNIFYYYGDSVSYTNNGETATYLYINQNPTKGNAPTNSVYWSIMAKGEKGDPGEPGIDGLSPNTAFKSFVFMRSNTTPGTPTGGSYALPIPTSGGWTDGIPSGEAKLWITSRIFSSDGESPQEDTWATPRQMTDTADFDVEYSSVADPEPPSGHPNTCADWSDTATEDTIWMATSKKSNGVWSDWQISKIKGESGEDGTSISIKGEALAHYDSKDEVNADLDAYISDIPSDATLAQITRLIASKIVLFDDVDNETCCSRVAKIRVIRNPNYNSNTAGSVEYTYSWVFYDTSENDTYTVGTHLWCSVTTNKWIDLGDFKGVPGDNGADGANGKNAYVHIKYANSLTENDWTANNGETPGEYIGIYSDFYPTDRLVWSLYTWKKWTGADGLGYEFIYKLTASSTAPNTPTDSPTTDAFQTDDYVPSGWSDDPASVNASYAYCWMCYRQKINGVWQAFRGSASSNGVKAALFAKYGRDGVAGADGEDGADGVYTEYRYAVHGLKDTPPALSRTVPEPVGWSKIMPTVPPLSYLWLTTAIKNSDGSLATLEDGTTAQWTTPIRVTPCDGQQGDPGKSPAAIYRGVYDSTKTYYGTQYRVDVVKHNGIYYVAAVSAGTFSNIAPSDSGQQKWNDFGAQFDSVATDLLLAENANVAGFIFRNNRLESQNGTIILDGIGGDARFAGTLQLSTGYSGNISDKNLFFLPAITSARTLTMGYEEEDIGKVVRLYNNSNIKTGATYTIALCTFGISPGYADSTLGTTYATIRPQEVIEVSCFELPPAGYTVKGKWYLTGRFGFDQYKKNEAAGRFPRMIAMGRMTYASTPYLSGKMWDGSDISSKMSVVRNDPGIYTISFNSGVTINSDYKVMCIGYNTKNKDARVIEIASTYFKIGCSDDASMNDCSFDFWIFDPYWYYDINNV